MRDKPRWGVLSSTFVLLFQDYIARSRFCPAQRTGSKQKALANHPPEPSVLQDLMRF
jgi:hypothetical protein